MLCLLLSAVLLLPLFGCAKEEPEVTVYPYTEYPEPVFTPGTLESDLLTVENGNYERANRTGGTYFLEVGTGYYCMRGSGFLYYADKTDLSNWVPVCADPTCKHTERSNCAAQTFGAFLSNDRLFYVSMEYEDYKHLFSKADSVPRAVLCSVALDGTDLRVEHYFDDTLSLVGGASTYCLFPDGYMLGVLLFNTDGTYTAKMYIADSENGAQKLMQIDDMPQPDLVIYANSASARHSMRGDNAFISHMLGEASENYLCWIENGEMMSADISGISAYGSYLADGILRCYRTNDGYYDINLLTGEETKLADAQLENGNARILLPNCILESTLPFTQDPRHSQNWASGEDQVLRFFDGQEWHDVTLPEEIQTLPDPTYLFVKAVTTDSVMFQVTIEEEACFYRMALGAEEYKLEYCGKFNEQ